MPTNAAAHDWELDDGPALIVSRGPNSWVATYRGGEEARIVDLFGTATLPLPYSLEFEDAEQIVRSLELTHPGVDVRLSEI